MAQDAAPAKKREATTLERIEVTGSRIKRTDIEKSQPAFSPTRDEIQAQSLRSVGDVIQNISANGALHARWGFEPRLRRLKRVSPSPP